MSDNCALSSSSVGVVLSFVSSVGASICVMSEGGKASTSSLSYSLTGISSFNFSNKSLVEVTESGGEELAQLGRDDMLDECRILRYARDVIVVIAHNSELFLLPRIALAGNRLTSLPSTFSLLTRLRYLTLRSNSFTVFPEVASLCAFQRSSKQ